MSTVDRRVVGGLSASAMTESTSQRERADRIPAVILTGFLGSGKTTLLNALLRDPAWSDSAVIVNEFGDIGLDHLLVAGAKENILLMDAGCLCCAVLDSLPETLADLYQRRATGAAPPFRRLLIETSGLAEPGPILRTLMRDPIVSHFYRPQGLVCIVDAVFGLRSLAEHHEAAAQISMADRIVVTKVDLTGGACQPELQDQLRGLNPTAPILEAAPHLAADLFVTDDAVAQAPWLDPLVLETANHHHHHASDVTSVSLRLESAIAWEDLAAWIDGLRGRYGDQLLRCKGILKVAGVDGPVILHGVQTLFDTFRERRWPDDQRASRIVVIGRGLDPAELQRSLSTLGDG